MHGKKRFAAVTRSRVLTSKLRRSTKIRPEAKIDNFAFKNSNIIIEGLFWKRKD